MIHFLFGTKPIFRGKLAVSFREYSQRCRQTASPELRAPTHHQHFVAHILRATNLTHHHENPNSFPWPIHGTNGIYIYLLIYHKKIQPFHVTVNIPLHSSHGYVMGYQKSRFMPIVCCYISWIFLPSKGCRSWMEGCLGCPKIAFQGSNSTLWKDVWYEMSPLKSHTQKKKNEQNTQHVWAVFKTLVGCLI